jgi:hypothetical protein
VCGGWHQIKSSTGRYPLNAALSFFFGNLTIQCPLGAVESARIRGFGCQIGCQLRRAHPVSLRQSSVPIPHHHHAAPAESEHIRLARSTAGLLTTIACGLSAARDLRSVREQFEQELRSIVRARSIAVCDGALAGPPPSNVMSFEIPAVAASQRARIEVVFDPGRTLDGWTCQVLEGAAHLAALLLEIERAHGRPPQFARVRDGAAPLIGSSQAIRLVRYRIERVAATDFTVLIEGASGPQPHPSFIEVFDQAAVCGGGGEVEGAGKDASVAHFCPQRLDSDSDRSPKAYTFAAGQITMPLSVGTRIDSLDILERIGAGGMREVYRARDTNSIASSRFDQSDGQVGGAGAQDDSRRGRAEISNVERC